MIFLMRCLMVTDETLSQDERPQVLDAAIEEVLLERDDACRDLDDGLLALVDGLEEPERGSELVLDVGPRLIRRLAALVEQPPIGWADPELRQPVLVEDGPVALLGLDDVDVRDDVLRVARAVAR